MSPSARSPRPAPKGILRRLVKIAAVLLVAGYVTAVAGGYLFLRYGRKIEEVSLTDVAFARFAAVRRTFARQQFRQAQVAWDAKDFQQAYVYFSSAVIRDPDNLPGRMAAARFFSAIGAATLEINLLEEGLARHPGDRALNEMLFDRLLAAGRNRHVLELLHGRHAAALGGANATYLQQVELQATFAVEGAAAAKALLDRHPALRQSELAGPIVARVFWEAGDHAAALQLLAAAVQAKPDALPGYLLLADRQRANGDAQAAIDTALAAAQRFPADPVARLLVLDTGADRLRGTPDWWRQVALYLRDFNANAQSVVQLAEVAGRRGWLDVTGTLYELGARRGLDLAALGLFHSDALAVHGRLAEARAALDEVEQQAANRPQPFLVQLRVREVAAAAALNDREGVRESARRLAALLRSDPDRIEQFRLHYQALGLAEAVAEFSERKPRPAIPPARRDS